MTRGAIWFYLALLGGTLALAACGTREDPVSSRVQNYLCIEGHTYGVAGNSIIPLFDADDRPMRCKP